MSSPNTRTGRMLRLALLSSTALAALLSAGPLAAQSWRGTAGLDVEVSDRGKKPVVGAEVHLLYLEVEPKAGPPAVPTDARGLASFDGLAEGKWRLEVRNQGKSPYSAVIQVTAGDKVTIAAGPVRDAAAAAVTVKLGRVRVAAAPVVPSTAPAPEPVRPSRPPEPAKPVPAPTAPAPAPSVPAPQPKPAPPQAPSVATQPPPASPVATPAPVPQPPEPEPGPSPAPAPTPQAPPAQPTPSQPAPRPVPPQPSPPVVAPPAQAPPAPTPPTQPPAVQPAPPKPAPPQPPPPQPSPPQPASPPPPPAPAPQPPPAPPTVVSAAAMSAGVRSSAAGNCPDCKAGEAAVSVQLTAGAHANPGACNADADMTRAVNALVAAADAGFAGYNGPLIDPATGRLTAAAGAAAGEAANPILAPYLEPAGACQVLAVVLAPGSRYAGYAYEANDAVGGGSCVGSEECEVGAARWIGHPVLQTTPKGTVLYGAFVNRSPDRARRAKLIVYFRPGA